MFTANDKGSSNSWQDKLLFLQKFLRHPRQVGSVTPSSSYLARAMADAIPWERTGSVAELGAGTGPITGVLRERLGDEGKLLLFEKDARLRAELARKFPGAPCYADVLQLQEAIRSEGLREVDAIVSGLPFANFPPSLRSNMLDQIERSLKPGGTFIAFQYSLHMKRELGRRFEIQAIRYVSLNLPPAFVYVCRKRGG